MTDDCLHNVTKTHIDGNLTITWCFKCDKVLERKRLGDSGQETPTSTTLDVLFRGE